MHFRIYILLILSYICINSCGQTDNNKETDTKVYTVVEQMPSYPGGEAEMHRFIFSNLRIPQIPIEEGIQSSVVVRFVVDRNGEIKDVQPASERYKGLILTDSLSAVIRRMPKWIPGKQNGINVDVYFTLPLHVNFRN